ncbi:Zinc metalloproteinase/disintegrin [Hondaea fermentalgiana]|uniref:Zinc metalloproteinase/disintegrin n=1 Tax=Hondaea fermentalgiana TaxID=2315210 RepID=A0A2R5GYP1_9STRA|nr:Zinc metalloproteinase/disintegrin [Hondaea fermentalgiana]|eukprot:GBG33581.1 Zinc metalloproteinase/disintegrin [Hondaea fermentalgiana]
MTNCGDTPRDSSSSGGIAHLRWVRARHAQQVLGTRTRGARRRLSAAERRDARLLETLDAYEIVDGLHENEDIRRVLKSAEPGVANNSDDNNHEEEEDRRDTDAVDFALSAFGTRVNVPLSRHPRFFAPDFAIWGVSSDGQLKRQPAQPALDCFFIGEGAVISFCAHQVRGRILVSRRDEDDDVVEEDWHIEPLLATPGSYVVYRGRDLRETDLPNVVLEQDVHGHQHAHRIGRRMANASNSSNSNGNSNGNNGNSNGNIGNSNGNNGNSNGNNGNSTGNNGNSNGNNGNSTGNNGNSTGNNGNSTGNNGNSNGNNGNSTGNNGNSNGNNGNSTGNNGNSNGNNGNSTGNNGNSNGNNGNSTGNNGNSNGNNGNANGNNGNSNGNNGNSNGNNGNSNGNNGNSNGAANGAISTTVTSGESSETTEEQLPDETKTESDSAGLKVSRGACGVLDVDLSGLVKTPNATNLDRLKEDAGAIVAAASSTVASSSSKTHFVRVLLVSDARMHAVYQDDLVLLSVSVYLMGLVEEIYREFPGGHTISIEVAGIVTMDSTDPWPNLFSSTGRSVESSALLTNFTAWVRSNAAALPDHDLAHLVTGWDLYGSNTGGSVIGLAYVGTVCDKSWKTGISQGDFLSTQYVANTISHELMHGLGAYHTDRTSPGDLTCDDDDTYYLMNSITETGKPQWSECTLQWFEQLLQNENITKCMEAICGDGLVEGDEECDAADDPCCDITTCQLLTTNACSQAGNADQEDDDTVVLYNRSDASLAVCGNGVLEAGEECDVLAGGLAEVRGYFVGDCSTNSCDFLRCERIPTGATEASCYNLAPIRVLDGTRCGDNAYCYQGACKSSVESIRDGTADGCRDGVKNGDETDVDCGGSSCLPCLTSQTCESDDDCNWLLECDAETHVCYDNLPTDLFSSDSDLSNFLAWINANPIATGVIMGVAGVVVVVLSYICCCDRQLRNCLFPCMNRESSPFHQGKHISPDLTARVDTESGLETHDTST